MDKDTHQRLIATLDNAIEPLPKSGQYLSLLESIGDARIVMIGEATHGTHEFYQTRIEITRQLIKEKGFMAVRGIGLMLIEFIVFYKPGVRIKTLQRLWTTLNDSQHGCGAIQPCPLFSNGFENTMTNFPHCTRLDFMDLISIV